MTPFQKLIKYIAIGFGLFLAISIIGGILSAIFAFTRITDVVDGVKTKNFDKTYEDVRSLEIDVDVSKIRIKTGNEFRVEGENVPSWFTAVMKSNDTLKINSSKRRFFNFDFLSNNNSIVTITIPDDFMFEQVRIESGIGEITIEQLHTNRLNIDCGVGSVRGDQITANKADINGGVGDLDFRNVLFHDTEIDGGTGSVKVSGNLYGESDINCGVGNVTLELDGNINDYYLTADSGLGNIKVNGQKYKDVEWNKNAENRIDIDGGVGNANIWFAD